MNTNFQPVTPDNFTRVNSDVYGNPRYVCHYLNFILRQDTMRANYAMGNDYYIAIKRANKLGGRKYRGKSYGGGIVFQSYSIPDLCERINVLLSELK